jgi:hypothetical protein
MPVFMDIVNQIFSGPFWVTLFIAGILIGWVSRLLRDRISKLDEKTDKIAAEVEKRCNLKDCPVLRDITAQIEALVVAQKGLIIELVGLARVLGLRSGSDNR